jgi:hypothetical protein
MRWGCVAVFDCAVGLSGLSQWKHFTVAAPVPHTPPSNHRLTEVAMESEIKENAVAVADVTQRVHNTWLTGGLPTDRPQPPQSRLSVTTNEHSNSEIKHQKSKQDTVGRTTVWPSKRGADTSARQHATMHSTEETSELRNQAPLGAERRKRHSE